MSATVGKLLVAIGLAIALVGALAWLAPRSLRWMGRLPGIVTCLVISVVLTIVLNVLARLLR